MIARKAFSRCPDISGRTNVVKTFLLSTFALICLDLDAQKFVNVLKTLNAEYRQEKLYLQFDRSIYSAGETMWFKAYVFAGNFPSLISKTLYTDLLDAEGKLIQTITLPIVLSSAEGAIEIPPDVGGAVFVRSYTTWMLNFDTSFLYTRMLSIIPVKEKPSTSKVLLTPPAPFNEASSSIVLQFFPESGNLVQGIGSKVAFKATDKNGLPVDITGEILDNKDRPVTFFSSIHDGMGTFMLTPEKNIDYRATWHQKGRKYELPIPLAKENGVVLELNNHKNQIKFKIKYPRDSVLYPFVYVVAQMNQQLLYHVKVHCGQDRDASGIIPIENLPSGIIQVTVFTPDEKPVAERIIFGNAPDFSFIVNVKTKNEGTGQRKKNIIDIEIPDTLASNLSVSVTDSDLDPTDTEHSIYSQLLLASDIKGYVHNPAYYFFNDSDSVASHLDLVMLTNGWRRFVWEDVMAGRFPKLNHLPENYILIEGQVKGLRNPSPEPVAINGILELNTKRKAFLSTPIQPDGKFIFSGLIFYDTAKFYYQLNNPKRKATVSKAVFDFKRSFVKPPLPRLSLNPLFLNLRDRDSAKLTKYTTASENILGRVEVEKGKMLQGVVITTHIKSKQEQMDDQYASGYFSNDPGSNSRIILPEDDPSFNSSQNLFTYLQGRIAGLQINLDGNQVSVTWRGFQTSLFVDEVPQSTIDIETGKFMEDPSQILATAMSEIAMVKIFNPPFFGASSISTGGQGGAIAVYLKRAQTGNQMSNGLDYAILPGYTFVREFYAPDYSIPDENIQDYRKTLYWNPFVITDRNNRRVSLTFYTNDITKNMRLVIEGCNDDGKLIRIEKYFN
jgi:hypothetical protein